MGNVEYSEDGKVLIKADDIEGHFVVPEGIEKIGESAFEGCSSLTSIEMPESVQDIEYGVFYGCSQLKEPIIINNMFVKLHEDYEGKYSIPFGVKIICGGAFECCSSLTKIEIPNSVTEIRCRAFAGCSQLASIEIPNSVTEIGRCAFRGCSSLTNIEIPNSVMLIGGKSFDDCFLLKAPIIVNDMFVKQPEDYEGKYSIPFGIRVICGGAFSGCCSLTNIEIPNSVTEIGESAFSGCM